MSVHRLDNDRLRCSITPRAGASIVDLSLRLGDPWVPILRPTPEEVLRRGDSAEMSSYVLLPYSNRIGDARFSFEGKTFELRPNTPEGHTIHGEVRDRPWRVEEGDSDHIRLHLRSRDLPDLNFPFPFDATLTYAIDGLSLRIDCTLTNSGPSRMPAGMGHHPYFSRTLADPTEEVEVRAAFDLEYEGLVPTLPGGPIGPQHDFRASRALGEQIVDCCFGGWDGRAEIFWPGSKVLAEMDCDPPLRHVILFTPPGKPYFALEPVSHANNGFNLLADGDAGCGVVVLEPGASLEAGVRIHFTLS